MSMWPVRRRWGDVEPNGDGGFGGCGEPGGAPICAGGGARDSGGEGGEEPGISSLL